ncbi:MAG: aminotransferase class V-fold PLP-dependent enzyme [Bryobacteraceae bacterium]|nr:aminotransferase class V-fold PLP-dependent enzyme [Bryobacteraceae bacterium]MDW8379950.1 aminotransferase class V-fold PLP-dependent enzyme [Bryobacterales bacterium]
MPDSRRIFLSQSAWSWLTRWWTFGLGTTALAKKRSVYDELGIRPILNFRGTHTTIGASKQWPELHAAMEEASRHYVSLDELQDRVGERLAKLIGTEAAMVTTGCAGAITLATCACVAGDNPQAIRKLPEINGLKSEVLVLKLHRNGYDHAVRAAGVQLVEVENSEQLRNAINQNTAMMYFLGGTSGDWTWPESLSYQEALKILKPAGVPLLVDAANMLPPWDNIRKLAAAGVDLIAMSGGKHMRGPQCSGILAGRKDLVAAARLNTNPHSDSLGRGMKVGREEIIGLWLAAEKYAALDFEALDKICLQQAEFLRQELAQIDGLRTSFAPFDRTRKVRRVIVEWDEKQLQLTAAECERQLMEGSPRIAVLRHSPQGLMFTVFMNDPGDERAAVKRMREIFANARTAQLAGRR